MVSLLRSVAVAAVVTVSTVVAAAAHTVAYGYTPGTNAGEVDFWFGSYHPNGGNVNNIPFESQLSLSGVNGTAYGPQIFNFDKRSIALPSGLVTGTNYFYADTATAYENDPSLVVSWMGVTATGLNPGDYSFVLQNTSSTTAFWQLWDDSIGAQFTLEGQDIGGGGNDPSPTAPVPVPAALPLLVSSLGLVGAMGMRRRSRKG